MANAKNENGVQGFAYLKPPEKPFWERLTTTFYDKSDNTVLGRTAKSWGQLLFFYAIFYAVLAALFAICMQGLFATLKDRTPKWTLGSSLIGINPGMGFRPISNNTDEGSLIWYDMKNDTTKDKWIELMHKFLESEYTNTSNRRNRVVCDFNKPPDDDQTCEVNLDSFKLCSPKDNFGYYSASPCIFLKLNRIFDWVPEYYNDTKTLPKDMPEELKKNITKEINEGRGNQIWISCSGENSVDQEHLQAKFDYYPSRGFPGYYYPFTNVEGYQSPLIAVRVINPTPNVMISIECRAWAKNIKYTGGYRDREGSVQFEIMVDG